MNELNDAEEAFGRIVRQDMDEAERLFSASSPNATRNSGFATSRAVRLQPNQHEINVQYVANDPTLARSAARERHL